MSNFPMAPAFRSVMLDFLAGKHSEYWLKGGRGSTKSSFISLVLVLGLLQDPLSNVIVYRRVGNTLKDSVYSQMMWAIDALGRASMFKFRLSPLEIVYKPTGQRIMFRGADDPIKSKSIKLSKGYFKYLWFEELTEFRGIEDIRVIKQSVFRGVKRAFTFYSYNPPRSANNWVNAEAVKPRPDRLVHHSTWLDVPPAWLGEAFAAEARALESANERAYRNEYLGEVTGAGGQVFDNLVLRDLPDAEIAGFDRFYNGLDFGFAVDPDAFVRWYYDRPRRRLLLLGEYYGVRTPVDMLAERVTGFAGHEIITCDSADPRMISELKRRGLNTLAAKKGADSIEHGMRWLQDLAEIVIDPARCPNAAREFAAYEYKQDRLGNFMAAYPDEANHSIDATRYAVEALSTARVAKTINKTGLGL